MTHASLQTNPVYTFNEDSYQKLGFGAQRRYPNEELCRFMGRNYFSIPRAERKNIRILELGSGSASNLWMIAKEGFSAHGLELSPTAIPLAEEMLGLYGLSADMQVGDMTDMPYEDSSFDCVIDVFSSYCIDESGFRSALSETARVLKPGGKFFIYTPGKGSNAWSNHAPATRLDGSTLSSIARETSAYFPSPYPFRFTSESELQNDLAMNNMTMKYSETVTRTYRNGAEKFEFITAEAIRNAQTFPCLTIGPTISSLLSMVFC